MPYKKGFSTGWWNIGKSAELVGLAAKIGYGATFGVDMLQIDLETIQEFLEPYMKEGVLHVKNQLGIEVGLHALIGEHDALEKGDRKIWELSHRNLCATVQKAAELGFIYINFHLSLTPQLIMQESQLRPFGHTYQVVGPDGRPLHFLGDSFPKTKEAIKKRLPTHNYADDDVVEKAQKEATDRAKNKAKNNLQKWLNGSDFAKIKKDAEEFGKARGWTPDQIKEAIDLKIEEAKKQFEDLSFAEVREEFGTPEKKYDLWKDSVLAKYFIEWGEIGAYLIVAHHMATQREPLWINIVESKAGKEVSAEVAYEDYHHEFNAAVAAYYLKWHLTIKNDPYGYNKKYLNGMSALEYAAKHGVYLTFETPHVSQPDSEGRYRLFHPKDAQHFVREMKSPFVKLCIDIEHVLSQGINPYETFQKEVDPDFGSMVKLIHLGKPIPYGGTAHIPIPRGSMAQYALYEWLYMLRERGFKDGWVIYERGGGDSPKKVVEDSIQVIRLLVDHLEQGIPPKELPEKFFGISEMNDAKYKRQLVTIRDHAWDPLKGLLIIPEEEHTFLSRAAVEKGKAEEWKRAKFR